MEKPVPRYKTLPPTPNLPDAVFSGSASIRDVNIWYALYGPSLSSTQTPVVLLHGGNISSRWWGHQIRHITEKGHTVIAMDTRGHGRSTDNPQVPFTYDLFADDVIALLDHLNVASANFVGWSDGANTCLSLAMRYGTRIKRIFSFAPNYQPDQAIPYEPGRVPFVSDLMNRMKVEYISISPTPENFDNFRAKVQTMQASYPAWTEEDFSKITASYKSPHQGPLIWIVTADSEELIQHWVAKKITDMIEGSNLLVLPDVSHFAPIQGVDTFNDALDEWLSSSHEAAD